MLTCLGWIRILRKCSTENQRSLIQTFFLSENRGAKPPATILKGHKELQGRNTYSRPNQKLGLRQGERKELEEGRRGGGTT